MDWKKEKLQSLWKINKEKLIFVFCSGLLLFILAMPSGGGGGKEAPVSRDLNGSENLWGQAKNENYAGGDGLAEDKSPAANGGEGEALFASSSGGSAKNSYEKELEERIRNILSGVDGVGQVDVMVVLKSSREQVIHVDQSISSSVTEEPMEGGSARSTRQEDRSESTVLEGQSSAPIVEKELMPEISGIVISADGGGSTVVKAEISQAMEALFGLPSHKIKVLKRMNKGA